MPTPNLQQVVHLSLHGCVMRGLAGIFFVVNNIKYRKGKFVLLLRGLLSELHILSHGFTDNSLAH